MIWNFKNSYKNVFVKNSYSYQPDVKFFIWFRTDPKKVLRVLIYNSSFLRIYEIQHKKPGTLCKNKFYDLIYSRK